ncbi:hypothetical protein GIB67_039477 [Kingdonia uniflora]|uniref:Uncharacterized protein n=1 Tax=Kingdonia uniflora TaxID=39325 RepID=A0A7J7LIP4_9MAGN|nr:hypothetical protein GIB67_039477 [Kingdonia uniflora]
MADEFANLRDRSMAGRGAGWAIKGDISDPGFQSAVDIFSVADMPDKIAPDSVPGCDNALPNPNPGIRRLNQDSHNRFLRGELFNQIKIDTNLTIISMHASSYQLEVVAVLNNLHHNRLTHRFLLECSFEVSCAPVRFTYACMPSMERPYFDSSSNSFSVINSKPIDFPLFLEGASYAILLLNKIQLKAKEKNPISNFFSKKKDNNEAESNPSYRVPFENIKEEDETTNEHDEKNPSVGEVEEKCGIK